MSKTLNNDQFLLNATILEYQEANGYSNQADAFDNLCISSIVKNFTISEEGISDSNIDGGGDGGIDSIICFFNDTYIDNLESLQNLLATNKTAFNVKIVISQIKNTNSIEEVVIDKLKCSLEDIFTLSTALSAYSPEFQNKVELIRECYSACNSKNKVFSVEINYFCKGVFVNLSQSFSNKKIKLEKFFELNLIKVKVNLLGALEIRTLHANQEDYQVTLPFQKVTNSKSGDGYIGFVKLNDYYAAITDEKNGEIKAFLFEDNVRDHQQGVEVNNEIYATLTSEKKENFWCLNNGITILTSNITPIGDNITLENIQIVNGLQTSYEIVRAKNIGNAEYNDSDLLIVKLVKTDDKILKNDIIRATNKQTSIPISSFTALDDIQINIEEYFYKNGFYYDRRKNFYKNSGKPIIKIISIELLAQIIFSFIYFEPSSSRSKPSSLIKDKTNNKKVFSDIKSIDSYLTSVKIFKLVDNKLKELKAIYKEENKEIERIVTANFKFHILRMICHCGSKTLADKEKNIKLYIDSKTDEEINNDISIAVDNLVKIARNYLLTKSKTTYDLISISKLSDFDTEITNFLSIN